MGNPAVAAPAKATTTTGTADPKKTLSSRNIGDLTEERPQTENRRFPRRATRGSLPACAGPRAWLALAQEFGDAVHRDLGGEVSERGAVEMVQKRALVITHRPRRA